MATDLAEFIGAALGLHLLFGIPLFPAGLITGVAAFVILALQSRGFRAARGRDHRARRRDRRRLRVPGVSRASRPARVARGLHARFAGSDSVLLAAGILGATVMPHVIYLHSALTQQRIVGANDAERARIFRFERVDVIIAMGSRASSTSACW